MNQWIRNHFAFTTLQLALCNKSIQRHFALNIMKFALRIFLLSSFLYFTVVPTPRSPAMQALPFLSNGRILPRSMRRAYIARPPQALPLSGCPYLLLI